MKTRTVRTGWGCSVGLRFRKIFQRLARGPLTNPQIAIVDKPNEETQTQEQSDSNTAVVGPRVDDRDEAMEWFGPSPDNILPVAHIRFAVAHNNNNKKLEDSDDSFMFHAKSSRNKRLPPLNKTTTFDEELTSMISTITMDPALTHRNYYTSSSRPSRISHGQIMMAEDGVSFLSLNDSFSNIDECTPNVAPLALMEI